MAGCVVPPLAGPAVRYHPSMTRRPPREGGVGAATTRSGRMAPRADAGSGGTPAGGRWVSPEKAVLATPALLPLIFGLRRSAGLLDIAVSRRTSNRGDHAAHGRNAPAGAGQDHVLNVRILRLCGSRNSNLSEDSTSGPAGRYDLVAGRSRMTGSGEPR